MTTLPRYSPDIERAVQADIRPRLLAAIEVVKRALPDPITITEKDTTHHVAARPGAR